MIDRCIEMLWETGCDSVQTIAPVGKYHPYWMFDKDGEGRIKKHVENNVFRRQDLPALFSPTGAVYAMRTEVLMGAEGSSDPHGFLGRDRRGLVVMPEDSVDIDTEKDLWVAEAVLRSMGR
jgi:N-acylneuraminate cytidylyltransferase